MSLEAAAPAGAPAPSTPATQADPAAPASGGQVPAAKPSAPAKPELFDIKVDGKVVKMTREEMIQHASLGHAADKRFKEAAQLRRQAEAVIGRLKDPKQVIATLQDPSLGLTKEQIRAEFEEWYSKEFIEAESLSPAEKRAREAEARLKKYEQDERDREAQKLKDQQESMTSEARETLQKQIIEALETSGLPKTNFTIRRLAYWMNRNLANKFDAPMEVVVGQVKNEINSSLRDLVQASDGDVLIRILGDDVITKLRKYDLEQLRKTRGQPTVTAVDPAPAEPKRDRPLTSAEVTQRMRNLQKTGRY